MKKLKIIIAKQVLTLLLISGITHAVYAQMIDIRGMSAGGMNGVQVDAAAKKLPAEQPVSLRTPANVKIDGKATEWNNKFQAYNHHTDFYYTMANDDDKLYLIIQATDPGIVRRIINGGVTLTISKSGKKNDKEEMSITYPVFEKGNRFTPMLINPQIRITSSLPPRNPDSLMLIDNKDLGDKAKLIRVAGINNVDTLISVYNADGIKATGMFDNKLAYTYELSVSLKNLGLSVNDPVKFAYQLMINEMQAQGITITHDVSGNVTHMTVVKGASMGQPATDFWGEYTLAK